MADTLTVDEPVEFLPFVQERIDELLDATRGADAAVVERAVCLSLLGMPSRDVRAEIAELFLDELEARGPDAAACLTAVAELGPWAPAERAREMPSGTGSVARGRAPAGVGALGVTEGGALADAARHIGADAHHVTIEAVDLDTAREAIDRATSQAAAWDAAGGGAPGEVGPAEAGEAQRGARGTAAQPLTLLRGSATSAASAGSAFRP